MILSANLYCRKNTTNPALASAGLIRNHMLSLVLITDLERSMNVFILSFLAMNYQNTADIGILSLDFFYYCLSLFKNATASQLNESY